VTRGSRPPHTDVMHTSTYLRDVRELVSEQRVQASGGGHRQQHGELPEHPQRDLRLDAVLLHEGQRQEHLYMSAVSRVNIRSVVSCVSSDSPTHRPHINASK